MADLFVDGRKRKRSDGDVEKDELYEQIGPVEGGVGLLKTKLVSSTDQGRELVEPEHPAINLRRQCEFGSCSILSLIMRFAVIVPVLISSAAFAQAPPLEELKQAAVEMVEARRAFTQQVVDSLFSFSELGYEEVESSAYLLNLLEKEAFQVKRGVAGMPTAFEASWGSGRPVIGFIADIDGLPETSQKPGVAYHAPLIQGGPGHGEGHNAGQAVNVTAALVVKQLMSRYRIPGTIRMYPGVAEELLGSRTYMVNAGLFRDVDVMLSSHVSSDFTTGFGGPIGSGLVSTQYSFHGRSAHGASSPWMGRSALDAVELMNAGWNYRREHLRPEHRSHYVIIHGGDQPNVVPPEAIVGIFSASGTTIASTNFTTSVRRSPVLPPR